MRRTRWTPYVRTHTNNDNLDHEPTPLLPRRRRAESNSVLLLLDHGGGKDARRRSHGRRPSADIVECFGLGARHARHPAIAQTLCSTKARSGGLGQAGQQVIVTRAKSHNNAVVRAGSLSGSIYACFGSIETHTRPRESTTSSETADCVSERAIQFLLIVAFQAVSCRNTKRRIITLLKRLAFIRANYNFDVGLFGGSFSWVLCRLRVATKLQQQNEFCTAQHRIEHVDEQQQHEYQ